MPEMNMLEQFANWKFYLIGPYPVGELGGLLLNIFMAVVSLIVSFFIGCILGLGRISRRHYIHYPCSIYIETVRATPLVMIIFWFYFFFPNVLGKPISVFWSAIISLSAYAAAYQAEIVRAGILAVPKGQIEAGLSCGMTRMQAIRVIVLPQAFKMMIPAFLSFFISLFKDTSVTYIIGMIELTQAGIIISQRQPDRMFAAYVCMATGYFIICYSMSHVARMMEKRLGMLDYETYRPDTLPQESFLVSPHEAASKA
jgi:polar amino acid transport system permease protein